MQCVHFADQVRKRINSSTITFIIQKGDQYIKYPNINGDFRFNCHDDLHLSAIGFYIILNNISAAVYTFYTHSHPVFSNLMTRDVRYVTPRVAKGPLEYLCVLIQHNFQF